MDADGRGFIPLLLIAVLIFLLLAGGYFASAETAFASVNKIRIKTLAESKNKKAKKAQFIIDNFDKALTTILVGNNICHISFSAISTLIAEKYFHKLSVTVATLIATFAVFFVAEMLPKSYAKSNSEKVSLRYASSLKFMMTLLTPLTFLFSKVSTFLSKIFIKNPQPTITEEELQDIIEAMDEEGSFENEDKGELVQNAMEFDFVTAADVLTSRVDLECIDTDSSVEEILKFVKNSNHSRIPVYEETVDNIIGFLFVRKFLKEYIKSGEKLDIKELLTPPLFVPGTTKIDDLFERMTAEKQYVCVVTDEYGGTLGIVTIEDIVEELVGDIWDENDEVIEDIVKIGENSYRVLSDTDIDDFFSEIDAPFDDEELKRKSFGVFCGEMIESMPKEGDNFEYNNFKVTVEEVEHNRIISVCVDILPEKEGDDENA